MGRPHRNLNVVDAGEDRTMRRAESAAMTGDDVSLGELRRTLARIELRQEGVVQDHEARLRRVERWVYAVPPTIVISAAAVIVAIVRGGP